MKVQWSAWLIALAILGNPSAQAAAQQRVIIKFRAGTSAETRQKSLETLGAKAISEIVSDDQNKSFIVVVAEMAEIPEAAAGGGFVKADAKKLAVEQIEPDYKINWLNSTTFNPGASLGELGLGKFALSAASVKSLGARPEYPWGIQRVRAPSAWDYNTGRGVRVAVIDTGVNFGHRDLAGRVDGGYRAEDDCEKPECYADDNGHGTHVAGTIAAKHDGKGVVGVAPDARIYSVKVLDADGSGTLSGVIKGIIWCANNGIQVANMSLGSPLPSDTMQRALKYAKARGVIVVAAAGNSGGAMGYPGAYPEVIGVAASDWDDNIAKFSSRGDGVDFIAPGVAVVSTSMEGDYASLSGTSMAAPHVAGLAAMVVAQGYRGLDGPDGVMGQLKKAATKLSALTPQEQGDGIIDASKIVRGDPLVAAAAR
jgi:subtilisin family serine protease